MRCSDEYYYVVKFQGNPQHPRTLVNELLGTRLAQRIGIPVPETAIVEVSASLVRGTPELSMQLAGQTVPCRPGLHFGSRYAADPSQSHILDYLPRKMLTKVRNLETFAGVLALDKWACNADSRQAVFWKSRDEREYRTVFIDQGSFFNGPEWSFPDSARRGIYPDREVYKHVQSWERFEPWLSRIETLDEAGVWGCAKEIPPEWYCGDLEAVEKLIARLLKRRTRVREMIAATRKSSVNPFTNW